MPDSNEHETATASSDGCVVAGALFVSVLLFGISLTQDGYYIDMPKNPGASCLGLLLIGWLALFMGVPAWLANPLLATAWVLMHLRAARRAALGCAIIALGFALSFLLHTEIVRDEAGHYSKITGYGFGYWLWIASIAIAALGCLVECVLTARSNSVLDLPR